jgi:hypothetical protein
MTPRTIESDDRIWQHFLGIFLAVLEALGFDWIHQFFLHPVEGALRTWDDIVPEKKICCLCITCTVDKDRESESLCVGGCAVLAEFGLILSCACAEEMSPSFTGRLNREVPSGFR